VHDCDYYLCKDTYHIVVNVFQPQCPIVRCICDWYYSLKFIAIKQVLTSYPASFPLSQPAIFILPDLTVPSRCCRLGFELPVLFTFLQIGSGTSVVMNFSERVIVLPLSAVELNGHVVKNPLKLLWFDSKN
jgi:hypothetical protein